MGKVENILGKGENADYKHFLLFPQCFQKAYLSESIVKKVGLCGKYIITQSPLFTIFSTMFSKGLFVRVDC